MKITKKSIKDVEKKERDRLDKEWSLLVRAEFNNQCAICGTNRYIHAHHIFPREWKWSRHLDINGIALCAKHHKFDLICSPHRNALVFIIWYSVHHNKRFISLITEWDKWRKENSKTTCEKKIE